MPLFMKTTPPITGDVTDSKYVNWIVLTHIEWGTSRDRGSQVGPPSSRKAPAPEVTDVKITKYMDKSSPGLLGQAMTSAGCIKSLEIDFVKQDPNSQSSSFGIVTLENVLILSYDVSADYDADGQTSEKPAVETYTLNFTKITFKYIPIDATGKAESPVVVSYDMSTTPPTLST